MEFFFESFTNKIDIKSTTVNFYFFELRQFYMITPKVEFINFMEYMVSQITKNKLLLDVEDFYICFYSATDEGLFYNPNAFDRYQEPEYNQTHTQFYGAL